MPADGSGIMFCGIVSGYFRESRELNSQLYCGPQGRYKPNNLMENNTLDRCRLFNLYNILRE